jgi:hypothetical protein
MLSRSEREISSLSEGEDLNGGEFIPGFRVRVGEIFDGWRLI